MKYLRWCDRQDVLKYLSPKLEIIIETTTTSFFLIRRFKDLYMPKGLFLFPFINGRMAKGMVIIVNNIRT